MLPDRDTHCSCCTCTSLGVRDDFVVVSAQIELPDDLEDFVQHLRLLDQAAVHR